MPTLPTDGQRSLAPLPAIAAIPYPSRRRASTRGRVAPALAALAAAALVLTGCGGGEPAETSAGAETTAGAEATAPATTEPSGPAPSSEAAAPPAGADASATAFETQTGTMTVQLPAGTGVEDASAENPAEGARWFNDVRFTLDSGVQLVYRDGMTVQQSAASGEFEIVEQRTIDGDVTAIAMWIAESGGYVPYVFTGMLGDDGAPMLLFQGDDEDRSRGFLMLHDGEQPSPVVLESADEARAYLGASPAVEEALAVMETVELHEVPADAVP
ncbi:hypothetical protein AA0Z99_12940 [Agrococcus sp. 1P02AA]|uniref:hypothetical protein n=1 Tax=Agrococcus sp. 1P02AA TaxID=3132259 RepID=UPI0039A72444